LKADLRERSTSTVAVTVSTYNQPTYLDLCLHALGRQSAARFEVADFGIRLMNLGHIGRNLRWTANALHRFHGRP
jgi:hypothetical protein